MAYDKQKVEAFKEMTKSGETVWMRTGLNTSTNWCSAFMSSTTRPKRLRGCNGVRKSFVRHSVLTARDFISSHPSTLTVDLSTLHVGRNVVINFNCNLVDDGDIYIGDNSIVGAGSVVTKDVASDTIVVGNPARVLRKITEDDDRFEGGREISPHILEKYK